MTTALGMLTIGKALQEAEGFIGGANWAATNTNQAVLLRRLAAIKSCMELVPSLQGWASDSAQVLNEILAENGLGIRLNPWRAGNNFGMVAINKFGIEWLVEGETSTKKGHPILIRDRPGFLLKRSAGVEFSSDDRNPTIRIPTKCGDVAYFAKSQQKVVDFDLLRATEQLERSFAPNRYSPYEGVEIPKVKFSYQPDMGWLIGLCNGEWIMSQALQEIQFGMDQLGAQVVEATAAAMTRSIPQYFQLNDSFLMWIKRPHVPEPLFAAWITLDDWKDPKAA